MAASAADIPERHPAADDSGEASVSETATPGRERLPATAAPPLSYAAFVANAHFFGDFCIALARPLLMLGSIARSLDPRVGAAVGATGGAPLGTLPAGLEAKGPTPTASGASEGFPYGSSLGVQVLHVARHLVWYAVLRPAQQRDWAGLLLNGVHLVCGSLVLLLAVSSRTSALWAWWRRNRVGVILAASLLTRCVLLLSAFLLLPPRTWPSLSWAAYVVNATTSPVAHALAMGVYNLLIKMPILIALLQALAHTAAVFVLAYHVAPTIVTGQRQQLWLRASPTADIICDVDDPVPLQCGSPLHPEHSALLSCRPLALQVLLGLAMVAWPVGLSWAVERRLRRQYSAMCVEWERRMGLQQMGDPHRGGDKGVASGSVCNKVPGGSLSAPAEAPAVGPRPGMALAPSAPRRGATYQSRMTAVTVAVKVKEYPGDFQEYGSRLASVLQDCVRQGHGHRAAARAVPDRQPAGIEPVLWTTVIRGCVQVVLWGWVPEGEGEEEAAAAGVGNAAAWRECLLRRLAEQFDDMEQEGAGSVRGVSVQVGQEVAVLGDPSQGMQLPGVMPRHGDSGGGGGGGGSSTSVRLLLMSPPAASPAAAAESAPLAVRLLLHSPVPQMARILAVSEVQGADSSAELPAVSGLPSVTPLLLELPVQLVGGVLEVEVELGARELAGAAAGAAEAEATGAEGVAADETGTAGVLRLVMVGPEHQDADVDRQQESAAAASPPLVHWTAPPLLLLPAAAAAEVCGAWEALKLAAGGGPGRLEAGGSAVHAGAAQSLGPTEPLASVEWRSSLWWSHMAPLLGDLAHALRGHQGQEEEGNEEAADPVWETLLPYLRDNGMPETLSLLVSRCGLGHSHQRVRGVPVGHGRATPSATTGPRLTSLLTLPVPPSAGQPSQPTPPSCGSSPRKAAQKQQPSAYTDAYQAGGHRHSKTGRLTRFLLPRPFSPPALELRYQQWRLERLAHMAPYPLFFEAGAWLSLALGALGPLPLPARGDGSCGGAAAAPLSLLLRLAQMGAGKLLGSLANVLGLAVVYGMVFLRPRRVLCTEEQQQQHGRQGAAGTAVPRTTPAVPISPRDVVRYRLAACVAGPAALLLCAMLISVEVARLDPRCVGSTRAVYVVGLNRALIIPSLQQMSTWEAVAAAPLLGLAEALVLMQMQVTWGVWRAGALATVWRLVAVVVSAAWERRSRQQFVQGQQGAVGTVGVLQGSGAGQQGAGGGVPKGDDTR